MLGEFPRYTRHVFGRPCEDVPVLTEEFDELAFLFGVEVGPHGDELGAVVLIELDLLCVSRADWKLASPAGFANSGTAGCSMLTLHLNFHISSSHTMVSATFTLSVARAMESL